MGEDVVAHPTVLTALDYANKIPAIKDYASFAMPGPRSRQFRCAGPSERLEEAGLDPAGSTLRNGG